MSLTEPWFEHAAPIRRSSIAGMAILDLLVATGALIFCTSSRKNDAKALIQRVRIG